MKKRVIKRILHIFVAILICFVFLAGILLLYNYICSRKYFANAEEAFVYPETEDGFTAQGIAYDRESDSFFVTGYKSGGKPSPVYVIRHSDGELIGAVSLLAEDGSNLEAHCGGIGRYKDYLYIPCGNDGVYVFSRSDVLNAKDGRGVCALGRFFAKVGEDVIRAAFCTVHDGMLMLGEYHHAVFWPTSESHRFKTPSGSRMNALAVNYRLNDDEQFGVDMNPVSLYTLPNMSQGLCFADGKLLVTASFGPVPSKVHVYDYAKAKEFDSFNGVPVFALDKSVQTAVWTFPPYMEEAEYTDGRLYVISEAASNKYLIGKPLGLNCCYGISLKQSGFVLE